LIRYIFYPSAADNILQTPKISSNDHDTLYWKPAASGLCSTKEAYKFLSIQVDHSLPSHGPRSISIQAFAILICVWKHKTLPPRIKAFAWRLLRNALASGYRASCFSNKIDALCKTCGFSETDFHLFFGCTFARAVWFSSSPPLRIDSLPSNEDSIQATLVFILSNNISEDLLQEVLTRLWYLWKARNDFRFNNKK
jgi:hypothetical protein